MTLMRILRADVGGRPEAVEDEPRGRLCKGKTSGDQSKRNTVCVHYCVGTARQQQLHVLEQLRGSLLARDSSAVSGPRSTAFD